MSNEEANHLIITEARTLAATRTPDVYAALLRFREQRDTLAPAGASTQHGDQGDSAHASMQDRQIIIPAPTPTQHRWPIVVTLAAASAILIVISLLWLLRPSVPNNNTITLAGPITQSLPDGSTIQLAAAAKITRSKNFPTNRQIHLSGDAFFTVAHDAANPFRVEVNNLTITVLGTAFNIANYPDKTEILVTEGLIEVSRQQLRVRVAAHQKLIVPRDTGIWQTVPDTLSSPIAIPSPASAQSTAAPQQAASAQRPTSAQSLAAPQKAASRHASDTSLPAPAKADTLDLSGHPDNHCQTMRAILDDIVTAGIVPHRNAISYAALTPSELIVNDVRQPDSIHQRLSKKYLDNSGDGYYYGPLKGVTGRGYFFDKSDLLNCQIGPRKKPDEPRPKPGPPKAKISAV